MNLVTNNKWIGQRTIRPDGVDKVTGRAAFAADTTMPGQIWGKILRSPHPHAAIGSIDKAPALALPPKGRPKQWHHAAQHAGQQEQHHGHDDGEHHRPGVADEAAAEAHRRCPPR